MAITIAASQLHTATAEPQWPDDVAQRLTLELGMFAVLFPHSLHAYNGQIQFVQYCLLQAGQFFSPFTLNPVYMLTMYAVRQVSTLPMLRLSQKQKATGQQMVWLSCCLHQHQHVHLLIGA